MNSLLPLVALFLLAFTRVAAWSSNQTFHIISEVHHAPLPHASLCIGDNDTCMQADSCGVVSLDFLIADSARMAIYAGGFADTVFGFDSTAAGTTTILMRVVRIDEPYQEVVVAAKRAPRGEDTYRQSVVRFSADDITARAGTADDISRYIGSLPSTVSSLGEGYDNTFLVRGGRSTETVFMVDGIEMENINHFSKANGSGGPIGFVNTDCVDSVSFHAGAMPVSFPPRLSSVVDISMKSGRNDTAGMSLGGKLTGGMMTSRGRLATDKGGYSLSARYIDFSPLRKAADDGGVPKVGDLFGKITLASGDRLDLSATGILSYNVYRFAYPVVNSSDEGTLFHNTLTNSDRILQGGAGITLRHRPGRVSTSATASFSFRNGRNAQNLGSLADTFHVKRYAANPIKEHIDNRGHIALNTHSRVKITDHHSASTGFRVAENRVSFAKSDQSQYDGECVYCDNDTPVTYTFRKLPTSSDVHITTREAGLFADYTWTEGIVAATAGIRADYFQILDALPVSPRISFSLHPERTGVFSGSFGLYHQFPIDLPSILFDYLSSFPAMTADSLARTETALLGQLKPERCWQTSFGYARSLFSGMESKIEAFYKWYDREFNVSGPDFRELLVHGPDGRLRFAEQDGKRKALGIEATIARMRSKGLFYSLSTSLFDVKNLYKNGTWYNDWSDVAYTFSLALGSRFMNGHSLALSLQGAGGRPFCPQVIVTDCINRKTAEYDPVPGYFKHRLDPLVAANVRYSFATKFHGVDIESSMEILNAFNYQPTLEQRFNGDRFIAIKPFRITPILGCRILL